MEFNHLFSSDVAQELAFERELETLVRSPRALVIHNDDFNTFDFVIETLIEVCRHEPLQAEQCAYIIHHHGKCAVKTDVFKRLQPMWAEITQRGLTATIEETAVVKA
jgi:ATP-dependent Clp protease adaptor protein ClpS